ncbi:hypothetical protein [Paenibacillus popilliae]|nr:hypothetical protein [Paenibacillus popilliae]
MLNELYKLSKALEHHGLLQATTHPNVTNVGKGDCLLIEMDSNGCPQASRLLPKEETGTLWKHRKGNHNSFPAICVQKPLLSSEESQKIDRQWKRGKMAKKAELLRTLNFENINPECSSIKISEWSLNEFAPVLVADDPNLAALKQLIAIFPRKKQFAKFTAALAKFLQNQIAVCNSESELDFFKKLLVGSWCSKSEKYVAGCITYFDVYEADDFSNVTTSFATKQALISLLNRVENTHVHHEMPSYTICPLSGSRTVGIGDKYPNPNIPALGETYFYGKSSNTPCLTRYSMSGTEAFQAGKNEVNAINDALAFITAKPRENKSWKKMSDSNRAEPNLLLAYVSDDPQNDAYLAQILGDPCDNGDEADYREEAEAAFDRLCQQVLGNMDEAIRKNPRTQINLIILEKLDKSRRQVVYERAWSAEQFRENLLSWADAAQNHPQIEIPVRGKKTIVPYKPFCLGPHGICRLLKSNDTDSGSSKPMKQSAVSLHEIYRLYMPQNGTADRDPAFLHAFLSIVVRKASGLLGDVKHQIIVENALPSKKEARTRGKRAASFVALISILLWHLHVRKEKYMLEAPYNIGQFLQLSDMLHKLYCVQLRNGGDKKKPLPTQLMGNEMLAIASENPLEGLNRLRDRMKIYLAWANTVTGEGAGLAKWILARYGEVSAKIAASELPEQFVPAQQAQVLLGYLATISYEKKVGMEP